MTALSRAALAAALAAAGASAASAEAVLEGVHWQTGSAERGRPPAWRDVRSLKDGPPRLEGRLRARLVLRNTGAKDEDGLLVRFAVSNRLEGSWTVPLMIGEKRVAKVGPERVVEVGLDPGPSLELHLRRLARAEKWPDALRIQAMLEPRAGVSGARVVEDVLEVSR